MVMAPVTTEFPRNYVGGFMGRRRQLCGSYSNCQQNRIDTSSLRLQGSILATATGICDRANLLIKRPLEDDIFIGSAVPTVW